MYLALCHANSAGTGIPCSTAAGGDSWAKLGHPTRGDLQAFQGRIDTAENAGNAALVTTIKEERLDRMHELEGEGYIMYWAIPPVHSTRYTVRAGDGLVGDDLTEYKPGEWINIFVRALDEGKKFIGLVMYARDASGNTVGNWQVDLDSAFRFGGEGQKCVTHRNAELKRYRNVFRFQAPVAGTGTITFAAIVKVGLAFPVLDGNFFYPNSQPLSLTEGTSQPQTWFQGAPGQSCDQVCAFKGDAACDLETLSAIGSSSADFYEVAKAFSWMCTEPIMLGCGPATPSVGTEGCFFHDDLCGVKPTTPPMERKDPCEGLTLQNGNKLLPGTCVKWTYVQQNNGIGDRVYDKLYDDGDIVKVCNNGNGEEELKQQDAFNEGRIEVIGPCMPLGGYPPVPTASPIVGRKQSVISCSAIDNDPEDGGRMCACTGGKAIMPGGTTATAGPGEPGGEGGAPANPDMSGVTRSSSSNIALVGAAVLLASMNQLGNGMPKFLSVLSLALSVDAHNWMSSPSRANNGFNAYQTAPCPPKGSRVHFQVQAGQKFPMEFATGHSTPARGGTYLTVLRAEDEPLMAKHTRAVLDAYIEGAPATNTPYMSGADFKSHHVGSISGSTTSTNVAAELATKYGVNDKTNLRNYDFWGNKPAMGSGIYPKKEGSTADDIRVSYTNPTYPWIISVGKFKLHEDKSEEADLVLMEIPVGSPTGQYVVQYSWNGYYDCTDVNVIDTLSTDFYGFAADQIQFDKLDHCLWNPTYENYEVLGECKEIKMGDPADACFNQCKNLENCYGVQVVPYTLPAEVRASGKKGLFQSRTSTIPAKCNNMPTPAENSLVCFPVTRSVSVVGSPYDISDDAFDSVFFGTCYIKGGAWNFLQDSPGAANLPPSDVFVFGEECISCDSMRDSQRDGVVPIWKVTYGECEHCNRSLG